MAYEFSIDYSVDFTRISESAPAPAPAPTPTPTPTPTTSPNGTWVLTGAGIIINSIGEKWTITTKNKVAVNGVADATTANVVAMYYTDGFVYHMNTSRSWYRKTKAKDPWSATTCPVPNS